MNISLSSLKGSFKEEILISDFKLLCPGIDCAKVELKNNLQNNETENVKKKQFFET